MFKLFSKSVPGNVFESLQICLPLVLAMAANAVNQFVDRVFLARYSDVAIQGSLPGGILSWLFICFMVTTASYSGTFVAQFWGAGSKRDAARAFGQGLWLTAVSLPLMLAAIPVGHVLFNLAGHAPDVLAAEKGYYDVLMIGGIFPVAQGVLSGFFAGQGRTRIVCAAMLIGNGANILFDWMFIFGRGGFPEGGIVGAAWATVLAAFIPCVILAVVARVDPLLRGRRLYAALRFRRDLITRIVRYGSPSGMHGFLDVLTFTVFVMLTGRLDAMSFAVSNICFTVNHLSFAPLLGFQQGASVLVGRYQGEGNSTAAARAGWSCAVAGCVYFALFALFALFCSDSIMNLFRAETSTFDPDVFRRLGRTLMLLLVSWGFFDAVDLTLGGGLKGAGDTKFVMIVLISISFCFWMPAVFLIMAWRPTIVALWTTMPFYCGAIAVIITWRWISGRWKSLQLVDDLIDRG